jgi:hypothetical protein
MADRVVHEDGALLFLRDTKGDGVGSDLNLMLAPGIGPSCTPLPASMVMRSRSSGGMTRSRYTRRSPDQQEEGVRTMGFL